MKYNIDGYYGENHPNQEAINKPVFLIQIWERGNYGHVYIRPVWIKTLEDGTQKFEFYDNRRNEAVLYWFTIRAQFNLTGEDSRSPYAIRTGYQDEESFTLQDIEHAESKLKFLRKLDAGLTKLRNEWGNSSSFGQYVLRVAKVMGIREFIVSQNRGSSCDFGTGYRYLENALVPETIEHGIKQGYLY